LGLDNLGNLILVKLPDIPNWSWGDSDILNQKMAKDFLLNSHNSSKWGGVDLGEFRSIF